MPSCRPPHASMKSERLTPVTVKLEMRAPFMPWPAQSCVMVFSVAGSSFSSSIVQVLLPFTPETVSW